MKQKIIEYPLNTEKSIRLMESENKLVFVVSLEANKDQIKEALEDEFGVDVIDVNTMVDMQGRKKAYVEFDPEYPAIDIATRLGLM